MVACPILITIFIFVGITEAGGGSEAGDTASGDDAIFAPRAEDGTVIFVYAATSKRAVDGVIASANENGMDCLKVIESPIKGKDGNTEFLAWFKKR